MSAKPKTAPAHPPFVVMVKAAITSLKEKTGSSIPAIFKYLTNNYTGVDKKILSTQLKKLVASGKLVKVKASYKLGDALVSSSNTDCASSPSPCCEDYLKLTRKGYFIY